MILLIYKMLNGTNSESEDSIALQVINEALSGNLVDVNNYYENYRITDDGCIRMTNDRTEDNRNTIFLARDLAKCLTTNGPLNNFPSLVKSRKESHNLDFDPLTQYAHRVPFFGDVSIKETPQIPDGVIPIKANDYIELMFETNDKPFEVINAGLKINKLLIGYSDNIVVSQNEANALLKCAATYKGCQSDLRSKIKLLYALSPYLSQQDLCSMAQSFINKK